MKLKFTPILLAIAFLLTTSCASIVSKAHYPLMINSTPSTAQISVVNKKGKEVYRGHTPATVDLPAGNGFFSKAQYTVEFTKDGYSPKMVPVYFKVDGWYFGNIVLGGLIGMLIVDPATGAMYKLKTEFLHEHLTHLRADASNNQLNIYSINEIPNEWKDHLLVIE